MGMRDTYLIRINLFIKLNLDFFNHDVERLVPDQYGLIFQFGTQKDVTTYQLFK